MRPWITNILAGLALICCGLGSGGCLSAVYALGHHGHNKQVVRAQQARVELTGAVQDENGLPLRGVRVTSSRKYLVAGFGVAPAERESVDRRTVNGRFRFRSNAATSVRLVFEKPGYAREELEFAVPGTFPIPGNDYGPPAPAITEKGICVTLRRETAGSYLPGNLAIE